MDNKIIKLLENINTYLIVTDLDNNIIYKNNDIVIELFYLNQNQLDEISYNDKVYSVVYMNIDNYKIQIYNDVTKYKLEIDKLQKDYLTNLYNRFAITKKLKELENKDYVLVMCDIDHFKKINDSYGHLVGDYVLKGISDLLVKNIKDKGIVGRYGGEEFIIVIPSLSIEDSYKLIEKIRVLIQNTKIRVNYNNCMKEFYVSMTFGMTSSSQSKNINELIGEADQALYKGKNNGRNQTNIYKKNED